jgi:hypothetical protein
MTLNFLHGGKNRGTRDPFSTSTGLSAFWQSRIASITGEVQKQLLPREHGQLKRLKESLGSDRAREVIELALTRGRNSPRNQQKTLVSKPSPTNLMSDSC